MEENTLLSIKARVFPVINLQHLDRSIQKEWKGPEVNEIRQSNQNKAHEAQLQEKRDGYR